MIETKEILQTKKYSFIFNEKLQLNIERIKNNLIISEENLKIKTDSISKFAEAFQELYFNLQKKENYTDEELKKKFFLDNLIQNIEKKEDKKKKKINSRKKGQRGEYKCIEKLSKYFPGIQIYRTPGSGAFGTNHNIKGKDSIFSGDLFCEEDGNKESYNKFNSFNWEVKNYTQLPDFLGINYKKSEPLINWIEQSERDCQVTGKIFTLLIRANRSPFYIIFKKKYILDKTFKKKWLIRFKYNNIEYFVYNLDNINF